MTAHRSDLDSGHIPSPAEFFGSSVAARPARCHEIEAYLAMLAASSERASLLPYGVTAAGRKLLLLTISSRENLLRLADVEARLRQLGDEVRDEASARSDIATLPAIVWIGCGIHGDEISGSDAACELAHRLLCADDAATLDWLDKLIIHLDPMANPDGRERFLAHAETYSRRQGARDLQDILHGPFWPGGRGNHYFFDLNRDALFGVQQEARARIEAIVRSQPQLFIDVHEMAAEDTYLFAMPAEPLNPHLPALVHESWNDFARDHAEAFDAAGVSYYTRSWNEVFYPGFFDIWPAYHGAVPILYEQAATSGTTVELPTGKQRRYREAIDNHLRSALANLGTAAAMRADLLFRWWRARVSAASKSGKRQQAWLVLPAGANKVRRISQLLRMHGVRMERLAESSTATDLYSAWRAGAHELVLPPGTLLVRSAQPLGALVRNMFDFHVPLSMEFLARERGRLDLGCGTQLADVTAWSLPLAFDAEVYWTDRAPAGKWQPLQEVEPAPSKSSMRRARYAYLYQDESLHATARLLARGVQVRTASEAFVHDGVRYEAGTMLLRREENRDDVEADLLEEQSAADVSFIDVDSARILHGPDLGGPEFTLLTAPRVGLLVGEAFTGSHVGALCHLFDAEIGMPAALLDFTRLCSLDLSRYNVLVLGDTPDGESLVSGLQSKRMETLRHWVQSGGTLIALSGGALALAEAGLTSSRPRASVLEQHPPLMYGRSASAMLASDFVHARERGGHVDPRERSTWTRPVVGAGARAFLAADAEIFEVPDRAPTLEEWLRDAPRLSPLELCQRLRRYLPRGAYVRVDLKASHWLTRGFSEKLPVLFREHDVLVPGAGAELVGRYGQPHELAVSGLLWPEAIGYMAGAGALIREPLGRGQIILFGNDPVFRGYSLGTQRLFLNAAIVGPASGQGR